MAKDNKGNVAGGKVAKAKPVDLAKPVEEDLDKIKKKIKSVTVDSTKKDIDETVDYALKSIKIVSKSLDDMTKKHYTVAVKSTSGDKSSKKSDDELDKLEREAEKKLNKVIKNLEDSSKKTTVYTKAGKDREAKINSTKANYDNAYENAIKEFTKKGTMDTSKVEEAYKAMIDAENSKIPMAEDAVNEITDYALSSIKGAVEKIIQIWSDGVNNFIDTYNNTFTEIAGRSGSALGSDGTYSRKGTNDIYNNTVSKAKSEGGNGLNINSDVLQALQEMTEAGYQGEELEDNAVTTALDKKIMPWLNESSDSWVTLNTTLKESQVSAYKSAQLQLQEIKGGNRLLQSGVIDQLVSDMLPTLENIDYNTMDENRLDSGLESIMATLMTEEGGGYSRQQAYAIAKDVYDTQNDEYKALTSGSVYQKELVMNAQENGGDYTKAFIQTSQNAVDQMKGADNIGVGAISGAMGYDILTSGRNRTTQIDKLSDTLASEDTENAILTNRNKLEEAKDESGDNAYNTARDSVNEFSSATTVATNAISNFGSSLGNLLKGLVGNNIIGNILTGAVTMLSGFVMKKLGSGLKDKILSKVFGEGTTLNAKDIVSKIFSKGTSSAVEESAEALGETATSAVTEAGETAVTEVGETVATEAGSSASASAGGGLSSFLGSSSGITTATGGTLSTGMALAGGGLIVAGLASMGKDAYDGTKKAKDWGVSKGSAGVASAVFGDEEAGAKKAGKQALKYGAIGAGIGTFIGGPVGTLVGGAIGAGVGALTGLVDTKKVAKTVQKGANAVKKTVKNKVEDVKENGLLGSALNTVSKTLFGKKVVDNSKKKTDKSSKKSDKGVVSYVKNIVTLLKKILSSLNGGNVAEDTDSLTSSVVKSSSSTLSKGGVGKKVANVAGFLANPIGYATGSLIKSLSSKNKEEESKSKEKTPDEKIVDAIYTVGSQIVEALTVDSGIDTKNGLLKAKKNSAVDSNMINLYSGSLSTGSIV